MVLEEDYTKQNAERQIGYPQAKEKIHIIQQIIQNRAWFQV